MAPFIFIALIASFVPVIVSGSLRQSFSPYVLESEYITQPRFLSSTPFQCNSTSFCSNNGECSNDKTSCKCDAFYTTFPTDNAYQCNYEQKSRLTAFLLQFFICGSGQMYLGNISALKILSIGFKLIIILPMLMHRAEIHQSLLSQCSLLGKKASQRLRY